MIYGKKLPSLFQNRGGSFRYIPEQTGLGQISRPYSGWSAGFIDYDNDGWKDLFSENGDVDNLSPKPVSTTPCSGTSAANFRTAPARWVPISCGPATSAAPPLDLNGDGFLDLVVTSLNEAPRILKNSADNGNHWLMLELVGTQSNRDAIGAKVQPTTAAGRALLNHVAVSVRAARSSL
jgi:hypothetical protein